MKHSRLLIMALLFTALSTQSWASSVQGNWRWRNDDGNESAATWKAAETTPIAINNKATLRLRIELYNTDMNNSFEITENLVYQKSGDATYTTITTDNSINAFALSPSTYFADGDASTNLLTPRGGYTAAHGVMTQSSVGKAIAVIPLNTKEMEYSIVPTDNVLANTTYYFRIISTTAQFYPTTYGTEISLTTGDMSTPTRLINDNAATLLAIYPNPATEGFYVKSDVKSGELLIYNITGTLVQSQAITGQEYVNISSLPRGSYIVELNGLSQKVIKN